MTGTDFLDLLNKIEHDLGQAGQLAPTTLALLKQALSDLRNEFPKDAQNNPNAPGFDQLPAVEQDRLAARLARLQQAVGSYADGSIDPTSIMYKKLASNLAVWTLGGLVAATTLGLMIAICLLWKDATKGAVPCDAHHPPDLSAKSPSTVPPGIPPSSAGTSTTSTAAPGNAGAAAGPAPGSSAKSPSEGGPADKTTPTSAEQPEVVPNQATLTTCQVLRLKVSGAAQKDISWPEVSTGSLSNDGLYAAPSSIAGQQVLRIAPTVTTGTQRQTAKTALITLVPPGGPEEVYVLIMIALMGALGGCLHWISGFVIFVGNREFLRSWVAYYLLMPIEAAALAIIVYLLLRVGILAPSSSGGQATAALNTIGLYAFAGMTGIYSKQALQALGEVFATIFKKVQAKDESKEDKSKADKSKS